MSKSVSTDPTVAEYDPQAVDKQTAETIKTAASGLSYDNKTINKDVETAESDSAQESTIHLTPAAIDYIQRFVAKRGQGLGLRLMVKKSGCSGYKYVVEEVTAPGSDDKVFPFAENLAVYVDSKSFAMVKGTTIDYRSEGINSRLVFVNPNEASSCGCGESFSVQQAE